MDRNRLNDSMWKVPDTRCFMNGKHKRHVVFGGFRDFYGNMCGNYHDVQEKFAYKVQIQTILVSSFIQ